MQQFVSRLAAGSCESGAGDAQGTLAFLRHAGGPSTHMDSTQFVTAEAVPLGVGTTSMNARNYAQPAGISTVAGAPYLGPLANRAAQLANYDSSGKQTGSRYLLVNPGAPPPMAAAAPDGGIVLAGDFALIDPAGTATGPVDHVVALFSGAGTVPAAIWGPTRLASAGTVLGVGVDLSGQSLVVTDGTARFGAGAVSGQWFGKDGTALTGEFILLSGFSAGSSTWFELSPLAGSALLVQRVDWTVAGTQARAVAVVAGAGQLAQPPAAWMLARPDARFRLARNGRGYAVLPLGARAVACTQRVEMVALDGTSCGAQDYAIAAGTCDTHDVTLGLDGTIVQQLPDAMEQTDESIGAHTCTWRWWTGAAR